MARGTAGITRVESSRCVPSHRSGELFLSHNFEVRRRTAFAAFWRLLQLHPLLQFSYNCSCVEKCWNMLKNDSWGLRWNKFKRMLWPARPPKMANEGTRNPTAIRNSWAYLRHHRQPLSSSFICVQCTGTLIFGPWILADVCHIMSPPLSSSALVCPGQVIFLLVESWPHLSVAPWRSIKPATHIAHVSGLAQVEVQKQNYEKR